MKTLFYYCYYRIAQGYRFFQDSDYLNWGYWVLFSTFIFITWSIAVLIFYLFNMRYTKTAVFLVALPLILVDFWITFFVPKERKMKKFKELEERYKNERHKKLKGWLIFLYFIGTLVLAVTMRIIFSH